MAYAPLEIEGLDWVIVAHIDAAEAFAPVTAFTRGVLLSLLGIVLVVSLLSLLLAQVFTRPINRLVDAVRRVAGGDLAVQVPQGSRDEIGDLGTAFNDMASSLRVKQELIDDPDAREREADAHPDAGVDGQALQGRARRPSPRSTTTWRWCSPSSSASTRTPASSPAIRRSPSSTC